MNETTDIRAVLTTREVRGWACPDCTTFVPANEGNDYHAKRVAGGCCAPRTCGFCGVEHDNKPYINCKSCLAAQALEKWQKAERVDPGSAMIYSQAWDKYYSDVGDYLDDVVHKHDEEPGKISLEPGAGMPVVCEFQSPSPPDLAECIHDQMYEDWDGEDWLRDLQKVVNAAFEANNPGAWYPGDKVPILPETLK